MFDIHAHGLDYITHRENGVYNSVKNSCTYFFREKIKITGTLHCQIIYGTPYFIYIYNKSDLAFIFPLKTKIYMKLLVNIRYTLQTEVS